MRGIYMDMVKGFLGFALIIFIIGFVYPKLKREIFSRSRYEKQQSFTHQARVFVTTASVEQIKIALGRYIMTDDSVTGAFAGGKYSIVNETATKITYRHSGSLMVGGQGDEFTASVTFYADENELKAKVSIDSWREKSGVTRNAGIRAMEDFINTVIAAFEEVDSNVKMTIL